MILGRRGAAQPEAKLLVVAEDLESFAGLRAGLEAELPGGGFAEVAPARLREALRPAPGAAAPSGVLFAAGARDAARLDDLAELVSAARAAGVHVILLVQDLPPAAVHRLMRAGADDFLPVPVPRGELAEALDRLRDRAPLAGPGPRKRDGALVAVYGIAGGVGATVYAVNLAWELALAGRKQGLKVALLDLDVQYGSVSTYLDLPRREAVFELLSQIDRADAAGFEAALTTYGKRLQVLTAPLDVLPLDILTPEGVGRLLRLAQDTHDVVVADLPLALTLWSETVLGAAERFHALMEIDMRSAQNMLRFLRALRAEELPVDKVAAVLNRAPGFGDFGAKGRVRKMAESLGIEYALQLPDGGRAVVQACDHGAPLAEYAGSNALRKEIRKAAEVLLKDLQSAKTGVA